MGFNCLKATELLRVDSLFFTTKSPKVPGTQFINLGKMKGLVNLEATEFEFGSPTLGIQRPNH